LKFTQDWLNDFLNHSLNTYQLANYLTLNGLEVDEVELFEKMDNKIIAARIESIKSHPDATSLSICEVSTGSGSLAVVCGAKNIYEGMVAPLALPGAVINGNKIEKSTIRGIESSGMLLSAKELGISSDHSGICELPHDLPLSTRLNDIFVKNDAVFTLELTANRGDCLSVYGIAKDLYAKIKDSTFELINFEAVGVKEDPGQYACLEILEPQLCPRYCGKIIKNVTIKPSPMFIIERLYKIGERPICNVVDITNYILYDLGHPMHAFDLDKIAGKKIIVRLSKKGEKITTLDGIERILDEGILVIADAEKPIAIAGIIGGADTAVTSETKNIFLEIAHFDPVHIRKTAKKLGISTGSSYRFERFVDPNGIPYAINKAVNLIQKYANGEPIFEHLEFYPKKFQPVLIDLRKERISRVLGKEISATESRTILERLGFNVIDNTNYFSVAVPTKRNDIKIEIDLIEEIARIHGYNEIPETMPSGFAETHLLSRISEFEKLIEKILTASGFNQILTYSMVSGENIQLTTQKKELDQVVKILNPLSAEHAFLRNSMLPCTLKVLSYNLKRKRESLKFFESGKIFFKQETGYHEKTVLAISACGKTIQTWYLPLRKLNYFDVKGALDTLFNALNIFNVKYSPSEYKFLHPRRQANIFIENKNVGLIGEVKPETAEKFDMKFAPSFAQIDLELLLKLYKPELNITTPSKFPSVTRDIAFLIDKKYYYADILACIKEAGSKYLEYVEIFDRYTGKQIPDNMVSMAFSLSFNSPDSTLTDEYVDKCIENIKKALYEKFNVKDRT